MKKIVFWGVLLLTIVVLRRVFFKSWSQLANAIKYYFMPDGISLIVNEFDKDINYTLRFVGYVFSILICIALEYKLIQYIFS